MIPTSPIGLYWNTRGNIRCEQHARELTLEQWVVELWAPIPEHEQPAMRHYQCQRCSADGNQGRLLARRGVGTGPAAGSPEGIESGTAR